jgi:ribose transport system permease protein
MSIWRRNEAWIGLATIDSLVFVVLGLLHPSFFSSFNIFVLLNTIALSTMIALGQMVVIAVGQMNLSLGSIGGLAAVIFAGAMQTIGLPPVLAVLLAMCLGLVCGLINGFFTAKIGISAFIVTLATFAAYKGINLGLTAAQPLYGIPASVKLAGSASVIGPVPWLLVPSLVITLLVWFVLARLPLGRQILAVGGNRQASELAGVSPNRIVILTHALSGVIAAAAGIMAVARLQVGQPTIGDDWLIPSFTAPIIGGAVLSGGRVGVAGTVCGVILVSLITQALVVFRVDPYYVQFALGCMILCAVGANRLRMGRRLGAG